MRRFVTAGCLLCILHLFGLCTVSEGRRFSGKCQSLEIPACRKLGYNSTRIPPNMYLTMRMSEVRSYIALLDKTNCSEHLLFFLCTMYSPVCFKGYTERILPCRSVCSHVHQGCHQIIRLLDVQWPSELQCHRLPEYNTGVCIQPSAIVQGKDLRTKNSAVSGSMSCPSCVTKMRLKRYKQFKRSSYAIAAEVLSRVTTATGETKLRVFVHQVLKSGKVPVQQGLIELWSPTTCICGPPDFERQYYILGKEDKRRSRLLFDQRTLVEKQTAYWEEKLKKWVRHYQRLRGKKKKTLGKEGRNQRKTRRDRATSKRPH